MVLESNLWWLILTVNVTGFRITYETKRFNRRGKTYCKGEQYNHRGWSPTLNNRERELAPASSLSLLSWQATSFSCCHPFPITMNCTLKWNQINPFFLPSLACIRRFVIAMKKGTSETLYPLGIVLTFSWIEVTLTSYTEIQL